MAGRTKTESKSPIKPVFFNMKDADERELRAYADSMENYSKFVKDKLAEDMRLEGNKPKLSQQDIAHIVKQLVKVELASIETTVTKTEPEIEIDMSQFF